MVLYVDDALLHLTSASELKKKRIKTKSTQ